MQRITRGLAHLRRLRQIMEEVYRLFDRRCRTKTALARLAQLRGRVSRCKRLGRALDKLSSPNLEKALTFLDDKLLPATSNAVERRNRRYRKAQKSIYSVRTAEHICQRIALDMQRDQQAPIAHRPRRPCIRPVLGRKNSKNDATVSTNRRIAKRPNGTRSRRADSSLFSMSPNRAITVEKTIPSSHSTIAQKPLTVLSWPLRIQCHQLQASLPDGISRDACFRLALP